MNDFSAAGLGQADSLVELKKKTFSGIGVLIKRQVAVRLICFAANIILARLLAPQVFGIYAIVIFVVQFFSTFADVGIGAALIQKKGKLSREEISTTFWLQQVLVWCVAGIVMVAAPLALIIYPSLPPTGVWLIRAMAVSFAFASLKTIPAILMERKVDFNRIALVDITETIAFYIAAISFALTGFEVWSFIIAALVRALFGVVVMYSLSAWRPAPQFRFAAVKDLVRFGLPYQGNSILGFIKDAVTPVFVGMYAGAGAVGYVNWAKSLAFAPLMLSETFGRVAFPAFSRIQEDRELLARAVERSIRCITLVMFPVTALMVALGPEIVHVVFTNKWLPGLWAYYFYCTSPLIVGIVLPMYSAILAVGKSGILLKMMVTLLALEWGLGIPFVIVFGFNGIAFNQPIIGVLFYLIYRRVLRAERVKISLSGNVKWQLCAAIGAGGICKAAAMQLQATLVTVSGIFCAGIMIYLGIMYMLNKNILEEFRDHFLKVAGRGEEKI